MLNGSDRFAVFWQTKMAFYTKRRNINAPNFGMQNAMAAYEEDR